MLPDSRICHPVRPTCLPQLWSTKPSFQDQLVLLTWPPWCRSSWPACPPCSHPWRKQPGSTRRTQPGMEQKEQSVTQGWQKHKHADTDAEFSLSGMCLSFFSFWFLFFLIFFFLWGNWRSNYSWFALRDCRSIYGSHAWGVKVHRIRPIAVISTERIKNEQAEKCLHRKE